jgi:ribonuclease HI
MRLRIYTDGGCSGNPGPGGWAFVMLEESDSGEKVLAEKWGAAEATTNNRMELQAVIAALEAAITAYPGQIQGIHVYTDSQYLHKGITPWIKNWKSKGWKTSGGGPVKNQDLWRRLDALAMDLPLRWQWVRGHQGDEYNERCDKLTHVAVNSLDRSVKPDQFTAL